MLIEISRSGLCCRLSILLYLMQLYKDDKLQIIWLITDATIDNIGKYLMPIDNIEFIPVTSKAAINDVRRKYPNIKFRYEDFRITNRHVIEEDILLKQLSKIKLCEELQNIVNDFIKTHSPYISIHVRRTDFIRYYRELRNKGYAKMNLEDKPFYDFIEENADYKVFLTTDCKKTRESFKKKYGDKIITYHNSFNTNSLRQVSMENTLLDLFIAGNGIKFLGTSMSKFSEIIGRLVKLNNIK